MIGRARTAFLFYYSHEEARRDIKFTPRMQYSTFRSRGSKQITDVFQQQKGERVDLCHGVY